MRIPITLGRSAILQSLAYRYGEQKYCRLDILQKRVRTMNLIPHASKFCGYLGTEVLLVGSKLRSFPSFLVI